MKGFWALPALLSVAVAARPPFSPSDDILAFPQYEIRFAQDYTPEERAHSLLRGKPSPTSAATNADATSQELQKQDPSQWQPGQDPSAASSDDQPATYETLIRGDERWLCRIPTVDPASAAIENTTLSRRDQEAELVRANNHGWELLSEMQGHCIYFWSGWWSYRYCFGEGVRQFHQLPPQPGSAAHPPVEDPAVPGFMLGTLEATMQKDDVVETSEVSKDVAAVKGNGALEVKGDVRYLVQRLEGGSICDLTGEERRIEVQFHCSPTTNDHIAWIKETTSCNYVMVINTPRLCSDVAFLPPQRDDPNAISCSQILKPEDVPAFKAKLAARTKKTIEQEVPVPHAQKSNPAPVTRIGDIVVGANKFIPEGREIKKSAIVGGGEEKLIGVIADSDGNSMSPEELKELGITVPEHVDKLAKSLQRISGDKGWKIEVVDTVSGREYRGVIGRETEEEAERRRSGRSEREEYEREKYEAEKRRARGEEVEVVKGDKVVAAKGLSEEGSTRLKELTAKLGNAAGEGAQPMTAEETQELADLANAMLKSLLHGGDTDVQEKPEKKAKTPQQKKAMAKAREEMMEELRDRDDVDEMMVIWEDDDGEGAEMEILRDEL